MHSSIKTVLTLAIGLLLIGMSSALAFSFDFGDDDDDWWRYSYWGNPNQAWVTPGGYYYYPRLPYFQRSDMVDRRQQQMAYRADAINELKAMLYGKLGFDRVEAIKLARGIESTSGAMLTDNFHPGAVATYGSNTTLALWGNQQAFNANALALQQAAKALAVEFEKQPTAEEGAVFLPQRADRFSPPSKQKVAVSPRVWEKFNTLSGTCDSCHRGYRGYDW